LTQSGIDYNSSERQIKLAYRKLALRYHPDKNKDAGAEELFKNVTTAYTLLTDEVGDFMWSDIWVLSKNQIEIIFGIKTFFLCILSLLFYLFVIYQFNF
jgi:preprotein translocase subunit Sec63